MRISYNWLKDFIQVDLKPEKIADYLTMSGTEVEKIERSSMFFAKGIAVIVVDKLDDGGVKIFDGKSEIIINTDLPLEKGKLYAFSKDGFIMDEKELGLSSFSRALEIDKIFEPGTHLLALPDFDDVIFEVEITPNRPDCLSHIGIARELSALLGLPFRKPEFEIEEVEEKIEDNFSVEIEDTDGCPRYACRYIRGVKIGDSPLKMRLRLFFAGIRPINNAVDVTNYVMLELGHPLHAFDKYKLNSNKIVIRSSTAGEKIKALDEKEYILPDGVVLITNGDMPVAIGGVIGGENSGISERTREIILESAYFNPRFIRRASRKLQVVTGSSVRFERGADPNMVPFACDRAAYLIALLTGGQVLKGIIDVKAEEFKPRFIRLKKETIQKVLGIKLDMERANRFLVGLGLVRKSGSNKAILYEVPTFRHDLKDEVDLVEEVGRLNGYGRIRPNMRLSGLPPNRSTTDYFFKRKIAQHLASMGFFEVVTNPFGSETDFSPFERVENLVRIINPISLDFAFLRPTLVPSILRVFSQNHRHKKLNCRLFEIASVYRHRGLEYEEPHYLIIGSSGLRMPFSWGWGKALVDIFDIKGVVENLFNFLGIDEVEFIQNDVKPSYFVPDESIVVKHGETRGYCGKITEEIMERFELKTPVYIAELPFVIFRYIPKRIFKEFERIPTSRRDVSFVVDKSTPASNILRAIKGVSEYIVDVVLFDLFEGKQIPQGKRNLTLAIEYQCPRRTLTDDEINSIHQKVIELLRTRFGALVRGIDL